MKKKYIITIQGVPLDEQENIIQRLSSIGIIGDEHSSYIFPLMRVISFQPTKENVIIEDFKSLITQDINPFETKVLIVRIDEDEVFVAGEPQTSLLTTERHKNEQSEHVKLNFERCSSRSEAKRIYRVESPKWIYPTGLTSSVPIPFEEWCWLPIVPTGIYGADVYQKYLYH